MKPKIHIQLGRNGDILNILPLLKLERDRTGQKPWLMVAEEFASLLDGVSYVQPLVFRGPFEDTERAAFEARKASDDVVFSQIYGNGIANHHTCRSFLRESWAQAGATQPWGSLPLEIDQRDLGRESQMIEELIPSWNTSLIVVCAFGGTSSPFPHARMAVDALRQTLGRRIRVVDVSRVKARRIHDMLGVLERASCLVSSDSGLLHLAHACNVPVASIVTRTPTEWHGSAWRERHLARFFYDEFPAAIPLLSDRVKAIATGQSRRPSIVHVWSDRRQGQDPENDRRMFVAAKSWQHEYRSYDGWFPTEFMNPGRDARSIGDPSPIPFMRDMIEHANDFAQHPDDVIAWTNADVCFAPGLTGEILDKCARHGAAFTHRWDFSHRLTAPIVSERELMGAQFYPGSDAFFFTKRWWVQHRDEMPDVIIGREKNDEVFRQLVKYHGGAEIKRAIYHEKHNSYWERPENFHTNAGNRHNRRLAAEWSEQTGLPPNDYIWWGQYPPSATF